MYKRPEKRVAVVLSGAQVSDKVYVGDYTVSGVLLGAALTSATIGFNGGSQESDTFRAVSDSAGNAVSIASTAAGAIGLAGDELDALAPWPWIQITTASAEGADRSITLVLK